MCVAKPLYLEPSGECTVRWQRAAAGKVCCSFPTAPPSKRCGSSALWKSTGPLLWRREWGGGLHATNTDQIISFSPSLIGVGEQLTIGEPRDDGFLSLFDDDAMRQRCAWGSKDSSKALAREVSVGSKGSQESHISAPSRAFDARWRGGLEQQPLGGWQPSFAREIGGVPISTSQFCWFRLLRGPMPFIPRLR